jgi:8-oxo-(d)GTP phosphatase
MANTPEPSLIRAAGAVLWRPGQGPSGVEVALIHRPRYDDWTFPKGKAKPGEHVLLNAVREVAEETGIQPVLGRPLRPIFYRSGDSPKRVDYWAATPWPHRPGAGSLIQNGRAGSRAEEPFRPNDEVDKLEWLPAAEAALRLTYERDGATLREFAGGPAATIPFILLRHASAGRKGDGPDDDLLRPLDEAGTAEAAALASLLACFGPARGFSSATARCVETMLPYVHLTGVPVTADPALTWGARPGFAASEAAARARLAGLLADGAATIVCGHGETLPHLFAQACEQFGVPVPADPSLAKAAFWVLHVPLKRDEPPAGAPAAADEPAADAPPAGAPAAGAPAAGAPAAGAPAAGAPAAGAPAAGAPAAARLVALERHGVRET